MAPVPKLMRVRQFCAFTGPSRSRLYRLAKKELIPLVRLEGSTFVKVEPAIAFLDNLPDYRAVKTPYWGKHDAPPRCRKSK
jgi:hypothetical protein